MSAAVEKIRSWVKKTSRGNPVADVSDSSDAQALKDWRGTSAREILEYQDAQFRNERDFYALGLLLGLWTSAVPDGDEEALASWWGKGTKSDPGILPRLAWTDPKVQVAADAHDARPQLYFIGGGQAVPEDMLEAMCECADGGAGVPYEFHQQYQNLGESYGIAYETKKVFDGNVLTAYHHRFGEEDGIRPQLWYDRRRQGLVLVGGNYRIETKDAELGASPGIAN